jgi:undecaprenyl-diphosphatase
MDSLAESLLALDLGLLYFAGSQHREWLSPVMIFLTLVGNTLPMSLVVLGFFFLLAWLQGRRAALGYLCFVLLSFLAHAGLKLLIARERPDVAWRLIELPDTPSFPSGHAMCGLVAFGLAVQLLTRGMRGLRRVLLLSAGYGIGLSIGVSRVYLGVHYPLDVLGGWVGAAIVLLVAPSVIAPAGSAENALPPDSVAATARPE